MQQVANAEEHILKRNGRHGHISELLRQLAADDADARH